MVVTVRPESGAVVPEWDDPAVIQFDEVIQEMPGGALDAQILLSPVAGRVQVDWRRTAINVEPREGWKAGRVYRLELLPGISDLRQNRLTTGQTIIFSTGGPVPDAALSGTALHWTEQRPLPRALIHAARRPDTVPYVVLADSAGDFFLGGIPPGEYVVHAFHDQNTNRRRERTEAYDSALVRIDSSASVLLWAFVHDTIGPRAGSIEPVDSVTVRLRLTQPIDPTLRLDTTLVHLFALPDTTPVALSAVWDAVTFDSLRAREQAAADSARRARGDTAAVVQPPRREAFPGRRGVPAPPDTARGLPQRAADTSRVRKLLAQRPVPVDRLVIRATRGLAPDSRYLLRVTGLRGLTGASDSSQQIFLTPKPAAADSVPRRPR
jgi:hypothetical protein